MLEQKSRSGHRIVFAPVMFEPGELRAVGYRSRGDEEIAVAETVVKTAGAPAAVRLVNTVSALPGRRDNIHFIEIHVVDDAGVVCPQASTRLDFHVTGAGEYVASDAGDATSTRIFSQPYCDAFHGKAVVAVRPTAGAGELVLKVTADGLRGDSTHIRIDAP